MKLAFLVAIGGAIGASTRYGVHRAFLKLDWTDFPWATLVVNVVGCFVFALIGGLLVSKNPRYAEEYRALILIGFCGALTTFSSFAGESLLSGWGKGSIYIVASVLGGLLAAYGGFVLGGGNLSASH